MIEAKIVADSTSYSGARLTTFVLTYPRFIHSEFMTHRMFSRNASSSRAIPVKKQIQMVIDNPAVPLAFTKNKPGMQGGEALSGDLHEQAAKQWLIARDNAVVHALALSDMEVHKQYANRILEPFAHITVVCTATDFANFFALRLHPMAQPEICELAKKMWEVYSTNESIRTPEGKWHLPFIDQGDIFDILDDPKYDKHDDTNTRFKQLLRSSVARCARVSYLNHEGKKPSFEEDNLLYSRLLGSAPIHASPAEHQAMALPDAKARSGNFTGWEQFRKTLENENIEKFEGPSDN